MSTVWLWLSGQVIGIDIWRLILFGLVLLLAFLASKLVRAYLVNLAKREREAGREIAAATLGALGRGIGLACFTVAFSFGTEMLVLPEGARAVVSTASDILFALLVGAWLYWLVEVPYAWFWKLAQQSSNKIDDVLAPIVRKTLRAVIIILTVITCVDMLSTEPVTSMIAGLGIGGLAIGLAAQDTIKNFFGSIAILADRPFVLGDRIVVDGYDGIVETVGMRTTRFRTFDGHVISIPNGELANRTIENVSKRPYIRRVLKVTITYNTPPAKVEEALQIIRQILADRPELDPTRPPHIYFEDFLSESLSLMVMYYVVPNDWTKYMLFNDLFNRELLTRFNAAGIEFAFPTRTLYLANDSAPLRVAQELPGGHPAAGAAPSGAPTVGPG